MKNMERGSKEDTPTQELWSQVVQALRETIPEKSFKTWIDPVKITFRDPGAITLQVPNKFYQGWIAENYEAILKEKIQEVWGRELGVHYEILDKEEPLMVHQTTVKEVPTQLNPKYTFGTFVVGTGNQFAHAAASAVAKEPGSIYNPLFIYGGVGLGKTHLLHAIGHFVSKAHPNARLIYISAEKFMNELIEGIRINKMESFRKKYRGSDILLVDDIQFIMGKEKTQEEFFHTFNELYDANRQIVVSSDRYPGEMDRLEERLRSRLQWGLVADIQPPDLETRLAILKKKSELEGINISHEVLLYIAKRVKKNVRELEGCLIRLGALASITSCPIDLLMAKRALADILPERTGEVTVERIQQTVCDRFGIRVSDILSKKRNKEIVLPRQVAMYLSRKLTQLSLPDLGRRFGGKDHTSVLHSIKKVEKLLKEDHNLEKLIEDLEATIED